MFCVAIDKGGGQTGGADSVKATSGGISRETQLMTLSRQLQVDTMTTLKVRLAFSLSSSNEYNQPVLGTPIIVEI